LDTLMWGKRKAKLSQKRIRDKGLTKKRVEEKKTPCRGPQGGKRKTYTKFDWKCLSAKKTREGTFDSKCA